MYRKRLRRVGVALVVIGLLDIAYTIYCIISQISPLSGPSIFAVVGGFYLVKGNLRAANVVSTFTALILMGLTSFFIFEILLRPLDFWLTFLRISSQESVQNIAIVLLVLGFLLWVYWELMSKAVTDARRQAGISGYLPIVGLILGIVLSSGTTLMKFIPTRSETARLAIQEAEEKYGSEYKYFVRHVSYASGSALGKQVSISLIRYNKDEIRDFNIELDWSD